MLCGLRTGKNQSIGRIINNRRLHQLLIKLYYNITILQDAFYFERKRQQLRMCQSSQSHSCGDDLVDEET
jgi:hypothetical protein